MKLIFLLISISIYFYKRHTCNTVEEDHATQSRYGNEYEIPQMLENDEILRPKRSAIGTGVDSIEFALDFDGPSPIEPIRIGQTWSVELSIKVPHLAQINATDMTIEFFVRDPDNAETTFAICSCTVESIGNDAGLILKASDSTALTKEDIKVSKETNDFNGVVDFYKASIESIYNTDPADGGSDYSPSTIVIQLNMGMLMNPDFSSSTATISAGALYKNEHMSWVTSLTAIEINNQWEAEDMMGIDPEVKGPSAIPEGDAAYFTIDFHTVAPFYHYELMVHLSSELDQHMDKLSVESISIPHVGDNHQCLFSRRKRQAVKSVTGLTNVAKTIPLQMYTFGLDWTGPNIGVAELEKPENVLTVGFTIRSVKALEGDELQIVAALFNSNFVNVTIYNIVIGPPSSLNDVFTSGLNASPLDLRTSPPMISTGQSASFELRFTLAPSGSYTVVDCTASTDAGSVVTGVVYGESGKYVGMFEDLLEKVTYSEDGNAVWKIKTLNSHIDPATTKNASEEYITLEITIQYTQLSASASLTCEALSYSFVVQEEIQTTFEPLSASFTSLVGADWYYGSSASVLVKLTLPARGKLNEKTVVEVTGDATDVAGFEARMCAADVVRINRGAASVSKGLSLLELPWNMDNLPTPYSDSATLDLKDTCGAYVMEEPSTEQDLALRVTYDLPLSAGSATGSYNITLNVNVLDVTVASQELMFNTISGPPSALSVDVLPHFDQRFSTTTFQSVRPFTLKFLIRTYMGTSAHYKIKAVSSSSSDVAICKWKVLNKGRNFPCLDIDPLTDINNPDKTIKLTYDESDRFLSADLDLGIVTNQAYYALAEDMNYLPDENSIEIALSAFGRVVGNREITVTYSDGRATPLDDSTINLSFTEFDAAAEGTVSVAVNGTENTLDFIPNVVKDLLVQLTVSDNYTKSIRVEIAIADNTAAKLCHLTALKVGANIPCLDLQSVYSNRSTENSEETISVDLGKAFHAAAVNDVKENTIDFKMGIIYFDETSSSASFKVNIYEEGSSTVSTTESVALTKSSIDFVAPNLTASQLNITDGNFDPAGTAEPGKYVTHLIEISLDLYLTVTVDLTAELPTLNGHATGTIHGYRLVDPSGLNLACIAPAENWDATYFQNATDGNAFIHSSSNNSLRLQFYLSNTGETYLSNKQQPSDDKITLGIDILVADHEDILDGQDLTINYYLKGGNLEKSLSSSTAITKPSSENVMKINQEFFFIDPATTENTVFNLGDQISVGGKISHIVNSSFIEAYHARIRIFVPSYVKFLNTSALSDAIYQSGENTYNISENATFSSKKYIEFNIQNLFFDDKIEFSLSLTIDPYDDLPSSDGKLDATFLMKFVCRESKTTSALKYCGDTQHLNYKVQLTDCFDNLNVSTFSSCQFEASNAIDSNVNAENAATPTGWSPAVRAIKRNKDYITVDFLRRTRVTKITFDAVAEKRGIQTFALLFSNEGKIFIPACSDVLTAGKLPANCRFEARYGRIVILSADSTDEEVAIGVSFNWFGCYMKPVEGTCNLAPTLLTTDPAAWRHVAWDPKGGIIYYCEYSVWFRKVVCYASKAGSTWSMLPSYVGSLAGYAEATGKMYAYDKSRTVVVSSTDGEIWMYVTQNKKAGLTFTTPTAIPAHDKASFSNFAIGNWEVDFYGLMYNNVHKLKWANCCGNF